jgi:DNA repair protein RadC
MVLFLALPRRDTKPIARVLISRFGSFAAAISAPAHDLLGVEGLGEAGVAALKTVQAAALRLAKAEVLYRPVLSNWVRLMEYLQSVLSREKTEQFRILFLDNRNRLLADEAQARGTVNHTPVYPREVVKRALELHATAIILVHNHPTQLISITLDHVRSHSYSLNYLVFLACVGTHDVTYWVGF